MFPRKIQAGDSVKFSIEAFVDVLGRRICPPDWTARIAIRGNGNTLDLVGDADWKFEITKAQSEALAAGRCFFQVYAEPVVSTERVTIDQGQVIVLPNIQGADGVSDFRTQNRKDLEEVQGLIRTLVRNGGVAEYRIGNRQLKRYDLAELRALESDLLIKVAREEKAERIKQGLGNPDAMFVRFR